MRHRIYTDLILSLRRAKSDKFDRYLVDVWTSGEYLNQSLVEGGYAEVLT
jgi:endonuclease YncB( thermonuclease family)